MNKHLDNYLCEKYPKIFADRNKSPQETCMCWGFPGDGWFNIIDVACGQIQHYIDNPQWVEKSDPFTKLKKFWNLTGWNWIVYPIAKLVSFREFPKKGFTVSNKNPSKRQWKVYGWFNKWFNFDIRYEPPKTSIPQLVADQVKEKFGILRFYYHGGDEYTRAIVSFAESLSGRICEDCGIMDKSVSTDAVAGSWWIRTTCKKCKISRKKK